MTKTNENSESGQPVAIAPFSEGLGPRCIECDGPVQWRCPTCAIRSQVAPLYTRVEVDAMLAAERERCRLAAHDAVMRALDEASVYAPVLRGMCAEVAMERFADELGPNVRANRTKEE